MRKGSADVTQERFGRQQKSFRNGFHLMRKMDWLSAQSRKDWRAIKLSNLLEGLSDSYRKRTAFTTEGQVDAIVDVVFLVQLES